MRAPASPPVSTAAGAVRRKGKSVEFFRAEVLARISRARLPISLCHAIAEIQFRNADGILYQIGTGHFVWVLIFPGNGSGYRAVVTTARRVTLRESRDCVLCASADDVAAALLAEIRRLRGAGVI